MERTITRHQSQAQWGKSTLTFVSMDSEHDLGPFSTPSRDLQDFCPTMKQCIPYIFPFLNGIIYCGFSILLYMVCGEQIICLFSTEVSGSGEATSGPNKETIFHSV